MTMKPKKEISVAIENKYNLTMWEAAEYFNIGINNLREIVEHEGKKFAVKVGEKKHLIIRHKFEEFIDEHSDLTY